MALMLNVKLFKKGLELDKKKNRKTLLYVSNSGGLVWMVKV